MHFLKENTGWNVLSYEQKNDELFHRQEKLLGMFLERGAISKEQYEKSLHDLIAKKGKKAVRLPH